MPVRVGAPSGHGHAAEPPRPPRGGFIVGARWPASRRHIYLCCFGRILRALAAYPPAPPTLAPPAGGLPRTRARAPLRGLAYGSLRAFCAPGSAATCSAPGEVEAHLKLPVPRCVSCLAARPTRAQSPPLRCFWMCLREAGQRGGTSARKNCRSVWVCVCGERSQSLCTQIFSSKKTRTRVSRDPLEKRPSWLRRFLRAWGA